jgi:hypothetical protein
LHTKLHKLTSAVVPVLPINATRAIAAVANTALIGTPDLVCLSLLVINSGPVWSCKANVCRTLDATYIELIAQVNDANAKIALKKCAAAGNPASTTAMTKIECAPTDWPFPLMKGWVYGTTNDAVIMAIV